MNKGFLRKSQAFVLIVICLAALPYHAEARQAPNDPIMSVQELTFIPGGIIVKNGLSQAGVPILSDAGRSAVLV